MIMASLPVTDGKASRSASREREKAADNGEMLKSGCQLSLEVCAFEGPERMTDLRGDHRECGKSEGCKTDPPSQSHGEPSRQLDDHGRGDGQWGKRQVEDRKSTRLNSRQQCASRMPYSA